MYLGYNRVSSINFKVYVNNWLYKHFFTLILSVPKHLPLCCLVCIPLCLEVTEVLKRRHSSKHKNSVLPSHPNHRSLLPTSGTTLRFISLKFLVNDTTQLETFCQIQLTQWGLGYSGWYSFKLFRLTNWVTDHVTNERMNQLTNQPTNTSSNRHTGWLTNERKNWPTDNST